MNMTTLAGPCDCCNPILCIVQKSTEVIQILCVHHPMVTGHIYNIALNQCGYVYQYAHILELMHLDDFT